MAGSTVVNGLLDWLKIWCQTDITAYHLCNNFVCSLEQKIGDLKDYTRLPQMIMAHISERPINLMLNIMQKLKGIDMSRNNVLILEGITHFRQLSTTLDAKLLWEELQRFIVSIQGLPEATVLVQRLYPFVHRFNSLITGYLETLIAWTKSLFKLAAVIFNLAVDLAEKGYCKPSDSASSEPQEGLKMDSQGVGMGDGVGEKNVSNEIEDKSQIEGLQGEDTGSNAKEEDNALDVSDDMEGDLEDLTKSDDDESQAAEGSEQEDEPEERNEALDPADPNAVDEKMWGGDTKTDDKDEEKKTNKQTDKDDTTGDEVVGREDGANEGEKENQKSSDPPNNETPEPLEEAGTSSDQEVEMPDTNNEPTEAGAELDEGVQEQDILDLPDDLKVDDINEDLGSEDGEDMEDDVNHDKQDEILNDRTETSLEPETDAGPDHLEGQIEADEANDDKPEQALTGVDKDEGHGQQDSGGGSNSVIRGEETQETTDNPMDLDVEEHEKEESLRYGSLRRFKMPMALIDIFP